ncbi:hypothetical protein [Paracidovorax avenae]|uniref:hypothetical protein n=1 Tax=Paracidovorax avenae TaxID=80867 RepID=UPI001CEF9334|nr:hypothetical protein [Paracidovorax avenae]
MAIVTTARGRNRTRESDAPFAGLPPLSPRQETLLRRWLASHAAERRWQTLLDAAGQDLLDSTEALLECLVEAGAAVARERLVRGTWQIERMEWRDLRALQASRGIRTSDERRALRDDTRQQLATLADGLPWLQSAIDRCLGTTKSADLLKARAELLHALASWHAEQRFGKRRDFALHARQGTKGRVDGTRAGMGTVPHGACAMAGRHDPAAERFRPRIAGSPGSAERPARASGLAARCAGAAGPQSRTGGLALNSGLRASL